MWLDRYAHETVLQSNICHFEPNPPAPSHSCQYSYQYHSALEAEFTLTLDDMSSLFAPLQNYAPEDETRTMIRKMIQEKEACLDSSRSLLEGARVQKEIASKVVENLRNQLAEAERVEIVAIHTFEAAKRVVSDIEDTISEHEALLCPIRRLPSDILCQIFECCIADDAYARNMRAPIRISSVCRTWRLVAHSLGSLWRHIDFSLWNPSVEGIFASFLERSSYYLNIRITIDYDWDPMSSAPFSFTDFQFDRIRTLIIFISSDDPFPQDWGIILHNLTRLRIYAYLRNAPPILGGHFLLHCQNLEELELEGVVVSLSDDVLLPRLIRLSWKEDHDDDLTPVFLGRLFESAPYLKSFSIFSTYPVDIGVYLSECNLQHLGELTSLRIECPSSRHAIAPPLWGTSLIPSLQHLTLASANISCLLDSVVHYAETAYFTKMTLEVSPYIVFSLDDGLVERLMVLRRFHNIETLEVVAERPDKWWPGRNYSEYFINCLCEVLWGCTFRPIFPALRIIRFLRYVGASGNGIIEMVKARSVAATLSPEKLVPLESVTFEHCEPLNVDEYHRLKAALGHNSS